jgi:hypothetical protein
MEQNETLQQVSEAQPMTVDGIQGRSVDLQSVSPFPAPNGQQEKERDGLVTISQRNGSVILIISLAPRSHFDRFQPTYEPCLRACGFR